MRPDIQAKLQILFNIACEVSHGLDPHHELPRLTTSYTVAETPWGAEEKMAGSATQSNNPTNRAGARTVHFRSTSAAYHSSRWHGLCDAGQAYTDVSREVAPLATSYIEKGLSTEQDFETRCLGEFGGIRGPETLARMSEVIYALGRELRV